MSKIPDLAEQIAFARTASGALGDGSHDSGLATSGIEFLRRFAGADSSFFHAADNQRKALAMHGIGSTAWHAAGSVGSLLGAWADWAETGLATAPTFDLAARTEAASDLMEQAEMLLADKAVHAAVPVMIAGAALEEPRERSGAVYCPHLQT